ncbi:MAG: glycosyltransferase family 4 protein [Fluviicola sp.]|nr:glycosyltransferase family 4 protein [Fluviicola sp.]
MKKVLIITYYWPPSGGSGVQRWLKFVKYLRGFGIEPVIYTVENPSYALIDENLESEIPEGIEVLRQPIWEPYKLASLFSKKKNNQESVGFLMKKKSFSSKITSYIRANYFIPDARFFWIKPSVKYLRKYLKENKIDAIISSGPPHSLHLIALQLKKELGIKWISDFRDPWTDIDYLHQLPLTKRSKLKHERLEREVLQNSDTVIVIGETMRQAYLSECKNTVVITNGFDEKNTESQPAIDKEFSITHIGLMNEDRNPAILWQALAKLSKENKSFGNNLIIRLIGMVSEAVVESIKSNGLFEKLELIDYLPHDEVIEFQKKSQILLLAINNVPSAKGIITGKIFEYLMARRPIVAIGPVDGDLAKILELTNAGAIVDFDDLGTLVSQLEVLFTAYIDGNLQSESSDIEQFSRKRLTENLAQLIHETIDAEK